MISKVLEGFKKAWEDSRKFYTQSTAAGKTVIENHIKTQQLRARVTPVQYELAKELSRVSVHSLQDLLIIGGDQIEKLAEAYDVQ